MLCHAVTGKAETPGGVFFFFFRRFLPMEPGAHVSAGPVHPPSTDTSTKFARSWLRRRNSLSLDVRALTAAGTWKPEPSHTAATGGRLNLSE